MDVQMLRGLALFDGLSDDQLAELAAVGTEVPIEPGAVIFVEGEHADFWWVLLDGAIELLRHVGRENVAVGRMDVPGRWAGGFRAWDEHGVYLATGRGATNGRVLRVPAEALRERIGAWFPLGVHLIAGLYRTARSIEATARQREALVTLGTLSAGLAHELNNPASAATRAVASLEQAADDLFTALGHLAESGVTAEDFIALNALRRDVRVPAGPPDPLENADREEEISGWLTRRGIQQEWRIAPVLATAGADVDWCNRAVSVLGPDALEPGLSWVSASLAVRTLLGEVTESTRRVSGLVAAVKSYSQMDRASLQSVDVTEGLESTLTVLGHKLRGVTIRRRYAAEVPQVEAYPGELNQVWTNLIDNAVDAMAGAGTLEIVVQPDVDGVLVQVVDSGPGMSAEVAARAFEPFYTTKDVGKGSGLGLDIARRIVVERHGGSLSVDSHPGRTVLEVRLPRRVGGSHGDAQR